MDSIEEGTDVEEDEETAVVVENEEVEEETVDEDGMDLSEASGGWRLAPTVVEDAGIGGSCPCCFCSGGPVNDDDDVFESTLECGSDFSVEAAVFLAAVLIALLLSLVVVVEGGCVKADDEAFVSTVPPPPELPVCVKWYLKIAFRFNM